MLFTSRDREKHTSTDKNLKWTKYKRRTKFGYMWRGTGGGGGGGSAVRGLIKQL